MPELPDIRLYLHALHPRVLGATLEQLQILRPFFLRSVEVPPSVLAGHHVVSVERLGKRIVLGFEGGYFAVIHLMIAGRFRWAARGGKAPGKIGLAAFGLSTGTLLVTEAGTKRRASLHLVQGREHLAPFTRGGLDVESSTLAEFAAALRRENHTLKRALTDPRILDGIGNAYSDELLHRAGLSPLSLTSRLGDEEMERLWLAAKTTLAEWTARLIAETGEKFPEKVTAFRPGMAVHGRYNLPCPVCGTPVQRIRYAENETNYCPTCQTGGRLLADRALSRLLREDWPRSLEELDELRSPKP
ncbi:MAG TPA: DNA-formamidopyrimidine glycosylase family protein [Gemmatimonadales bacterium]|nr:DNA-formamidopyrimidine glycosylase family protein [Gemmatimonadales bacterium]